MGMFSEKHDEEIYDLHKENAALLRTLDHVTDLAAERWLEIEKLKAGRLESPEPWGRAEYLAYARR